MSRSESLFAPVSRTVLHALHDAGGRRARLLLALSGGADSTALLRSALDCRSELKLELVAAHLNHRARGEASTADADWLVTLCRSLGVPLILEEIDVPAQAKSAGLGFEEAARTIRYEFLDRTAITQNCPLLAVAHNTDDLAETVLHNLLRGTGIAGLKGIPRERMLPGGTRLIRPLLAVTRAEILDYLAGLGQEYRTDATNADLEATRNRLRLDLLPKLREEYNPQLARALSRLATQAEDVQQAIAFAARDLAFQTREKIEAADWGIRWQELQQHPRHLLREMFVAIWIDLDWPRQEMTFAHWDRLATQITVGGRNQFPGGIDVQRSGRLLRLRREVDRTG